MARYVFTPKRRAALKRAQAKSAAKRKGSGRGKRIATGVAIGGAAVAVGVGAAYAKKTAAGGPQKRKGDYYTRSLKPGKKGNQTSKRYKRRGPSVSQSRRNRGRGLPPGQRFTAIDPANKQSQGYAPKTHSTRRTRAVQRKRAARAGTYGGGLFTGKTAGRPVFQPNDRAFARLNGGSHGKYGSRNPRRK